MRKIHRRTFISGLAVVIDRSKKATTPPTTLQIHIVLCNDGTDNENK